MKTIDGCDLCSVRRRFGKYRNRRGPDMCWEWSGARTSDGYGNFKIGGRTFGAHRVAFFFSAGRWPTKPYVMHTCDNPPCVNPAHLIEGTPKDNAVDRSRKDRGNRPIGDRCTRSKLKADQVIRVRAMRGAGMTNRAIADVFGVTPEAISSICLRKVWKHVP